MVERQAHVVLDLRSRQWKAVKIERLLQLADRLGSLRILEVGTGSGGIASYFGTHPSGRFVVEAVDVVDNRQVSVGYGFTLVHGTQLPFDDASFDVVVTNHVIEHVGEREQQLAHLAEVHRVMKPNAVGYFAVPNRWMLVEPHYGLAFLSWLPKSWRSVYLRLRRRGQFYDCEPLTLPEAEALLSQAGFTFRNQCVEAMRATIDIEQAPWLTARAINALPDWVVRRLLAVFPTLIYRFGPGRIEAEPAA